MIRRAQVEASFEIDVAHEIESFADEQMAPSFELSDYSIGDLREPTVEEIDDSWIIQLDDAPVEPTREQQPPPSHDDTLSTTSWDDEEYETLFMEFISDVEVLPILDDKDHAMDMSFG
jgi:hypothetical protein